MASNSNNNKWKQQTTIDRNITCWNSSSTDCSPSTSKTMVRKHSVKVRRPLSPTNRLNMQRNSINRYPNQERITTFINSHLRSPFLSSSYSSTHRCRRNPRMRRSQVTLDSVARYSWLSSFAFQLWSSTGFYINCVALTFSHRNIHNCSRRTH